MMPAGFDINQALPTTPLAPTVNRLKGLKLALPKLTTDEQREWWAVYQASTPPPEDPAAIMPAPSQRRRRKAPASEVGSQSDVDAVLAGPSSPASQPPASQPPADGAFPPASRKAAKRKVAVKQTLKGMPAKARKGPKALKAKTKDPERAAPKRRLRKGQQQASQLEPEEYQQDSEMADIPEPIAPRINDKTSDLDEYSDDDDDICPICNTHDDPLEKEPDFPSETDRWMYCIACEQWIHVACTKWVNTPTLMIDNYCYICMKHLQHASGGGPGNKEKPEK